MKLMRNNDSCCVKVFDGNVEGALRAFKKQVGFNGVFKTIKFRERYPGNGDRKKAKQMRARKRLERAREKGRSWKNY